MKFRNIVILAIVAAALVAAAKFTSGNRRARTPDIAGTPVLPGLDLAGVAAVEISESGSALRIEQSGDAWTVTNAFGYPADFARLRQAMIELADLKVGHVQHGMEIDPASSIKVSLFGADGAELASLLLGGTRDSGRQQETPYGMMGGGADGRYVAPAGSSQTFLVKENLDGFVADPRAWLDSELLSLQSSDVARIELVAPGGAKTSFDRSSGRLAMEGLAEGEEFDSSKSYGLESALAYLRLAGIADPALDDAATGLADGAASVFAATTKDGTTYTARIGAASPDGDRYARFAIDCGTNSVPAEVAAKQSLFAKYTYLIPSYNAQNMTRVRADFIKAPPAPAETAGEEE